MILGFMPGQLARERPPGSAANQLASDSRRRRIHRRHLLLTARSFIAARRTCAGAHPLRTNSDLVLRIRLQIHVPARMRRRATLRANDEVFPIHLLIEERQLTELTALRAARDQEQRR